LSDAPARPAVLIAEDEPLLARTLEKVLREGWPELATIETATDGVAAVERALEIAPDVLFLDIKMPGHTGFEVAEIVADDWPADRPAPLIVFVTAFDEFAVDAFERAAVDYVLKPATPERLAITIGRLRERLSARAPVPAAGDMAALFGRMQSIAGPGPAPGERIRVIRASVGNTVRLIPVSDVICLEAADKYVTVVTPAGEALVRLSLRELAARLEGIELVQVHRATMVNAACMASATRDDLGQMHLNLRGLERPVKVSRAFAHLFRPM
jgi:DNA-binding LytR/AlgR family response regulator